MNGRRRLIVRFAAGAVLAIVAGVVGTRSFWKTPPAEVSPPRFELLRGELELREGRLYARGESEAFNGMLVEDYSAGQRKLEIEIREGRANGLSRGWFADGQREVEETFLNGVSHGPRMRWHENGEPKSLAAIENGQVTGEYLEWYDNGQLATKMVVEQGQPVGLVESWHPSGARKSEVRFEHGRQVSQQFFGDSAESSDALVSTPPPTAAADRGRD